MRDHDHNEDRTEQVVSTLLSAAGKAPVPPDEVFLDRLSGETVKAFITASAQRPNRFWGYRIMHSRTIKWLIPVAAAAAVVLAVIEFRPGQRGGHVSNGIVWADVVRQVETALTAHLKITSRDKDINDGRETTAEIYLKMPDRMRQIVPPTVAGDDRFNNVIAIVSGNRMLQLYPDEKRYTLEDTDVLKTNPVEKTLRDNLLFPGSLDSSTSPTVSMTGGRTLIHEGSRERKGRTLLRYRLEEAKESPPESKGKPRDNWLYMYFDPATRSPAAIGAEREIDGKRVETMTWEIELNPDLPDELFSLDPPADYVRVVAIPDDVREFTAQYRKSRDLIRRYRMVVWEESAPWVRGLRDGNKLRADFFRSRPRMDPARDFEAAWGLPAETVSVVHDGKVNHPDAWRYFLPDMGWPAMPDSQTWVGSEPTWIYQRVPERADRPGLVGIRADDTYGTDTDSHTMYLFWVDPDRDYLCVVHEEHHRKGRPWKNRPDWAPSEPDGAPAEAARIGGGSEMDLIREIMESGQTPDGHWYPKTIRRTFHTVSGGKRYLWGEPTVTSIQLDVTGPIPDNAFERPTETSKPQ